MDDVGTLLLDAELDGIQDVRTLSYLDAVRVDPQSLFVSREM